MKLTKSTKIFITGCGGMLGEAAYKILSSRSRVLATDKDFNESFLSFADLRNFTDMRDQITTYSPDIVFNLGALTDLEYCEQHVDETWHVNTMAVENLAQICRDIDVRMVHISTAGIFNGKQEFYTDYDLPDPLCVYGKSKYASELAVQRVWAKHFIFRAGWMMGGGPKKDKKFVNKIIKQINNGKKELFVVDDKLGTPTYTFDFIENIVRVIEHDIYGLYNLVCEGSCSRFEVAREILTLLNRNDVKLSEVSSDYFKKEYFALRPASEQLIPFKLKKLNLYFMRDWKTCLKEYVEQFSIL